MPVNDVVVLGSKGWKVVTHDRNQGVQNSAEYVRSALLSVRIRLEICRKYSSSSIVSVDINSCSKPTSSRDALKVLQGLPNHLCPSAQNPCFDD